jgi:hypothetical protein
MPPKLPLLAWEGVNPNEGVRTRSRHTLLGSTPLPSRSSTPADLSSASDRQQRPSEGVSTPLTSTAPDEDTESAMGMSTTEPGHEASLSSTNQQHESNEQAVTTSDRNVPSISTAAPPQVSSTTFDADNDVQMEEDVAGGALQMNSFDEQDQITSFISLPYNQTTTRSSQQQNLDVDPVFNFDLQTQIAAPPAKPNLHTHNLNNTTLNNYLRDQSLFHSPFETDLEDKLPTQPNSPTSDMEQGGGSEIGSEIGSNLTTNSTEQTIDILRAENEDLKAENNYFRLMAAISGTGCECAPIPADHQNLTDFSSCNSCAQPPHPHQPQQLPA